MEFDPSKIPEDDLREVYNMLYRYDKGKCLGEILREMCRTYAYASSSSKNFDKKFYIQPFCLVEDFLRWFCALIKFFIPIQEQLETPVLRNFIMNNDTDTDTKSKEPS